MGMRMPSIMTIGLVVVALTGCALADPSQAPTPRPSVVPTASPAPAPVRSFGVSCDDLASIVDASGVFAAPVGPEMRASSRADGWGSWMYSGGSDVIAAGGLSCEVAPGPIVRIEALGAAGADFDEAVAAAGGSLDPIGRVAHTVSDVADGGIATCRDAGGGGLCTWSVRSGDAWVVVELYPLAPAELVFPPDLPNGWAQSPYPAPGSSGLNLVEALADAIGSSSTGDVIPAAQAVDRSCIDIAQSEAIVAEFGVDPAAVSVVEGTPRDFAASVASTAGRALPEYAAARLGRETCRAVWSDPDLSAVSGLPAYSSLEIVVRPATGEMPLTPWTGCGGPMDSSQATCQVFVASDEQLSAAIFATDGTAETAEASLRRILGEP